MVRVTLAWSDAPRRVIEMQLDLPEGSTVRRAVEALGTSSPDSGAPAADLVPGRWGRAVSGDQVLQDGDRLEWCRPLAVDPKLARRERFRKQGSRGTGLFAARRRDGKPGY